ncbi:2-succinyl-6-hydroxy-2,4-cyclohexadiene-1-carboxylate synthase [Bacillaceae bacterium W0354]
MFVQVNRNKYYVEVTGTGEPLVFFHGFTGSTKTWDDAVSKLSKSYQCITIDLPGHGQTEIEQLDSMEQAVDELIEVLKKINVYRFSLIGYSMGGRTALVLAAKHMDSINKLILVGASPGLEGNEKTNRIRNDEKLAQFIKERGIVDFIDYWEKIPLFKTHEMLDEHTKYKLREERINQSVDGLILSLKTMGTGAQPSIWNGLSYINIPILLITGELDHKFCLINEHMKESLPNANHVVVPAVGHAVHLESPTSFGKIIKEFLKAT